MNSTEATSSSAGRDSEASAFNMVTNLKAWLLVKVSTIESPALKFTSNVRPGRGPVLEQSESVGGKHLKLSSFMDQKQPW